MRTVTATSLVTGAYRLLGVVGQGETVGTDLLTEGVTSLNDLIDDWSTQALTIPCTTREAFTLTIGQQTYTIGDGGDLDTERPLSIDAASILINPASVLSVTSITRSGTTATVTITAHGYSTGQNITIAGATQTAYNGTFIITVLTANTFTYQVSGAPATPATGTKTAQDAIGQAYEVYLDMLTYDAYIAEPFKGETNQWPTRGYYNPTYADGFGSLFLWPIPTTAATLIPYCGRPLSQFNESSLSVEMILPPAAARALRYNLAVELIPANGKDENSMAAQTVIKTAQTSLANLKRQNDRPTVLSIGLAGMLFGWRGRNSSDFNIYSGP